jgi:hypothetical protein
VGLVAQNATAILPNAPTSVRAAAALAAAALNARRRCPQRPPPLPSTPAAAALNARRRCPQRPPPLPSTPAAAAPAASRALQWRSHLEGYTHYGYTDHGCTNTY